MNDFVYDIPVKVYFGKDQLCHLGEELKKYGQKVLLTSRFENPYVNPKK